MDKIVRFEADSELWFVNLSKAQVQQSGGDVLIHFNLDEDDIDDECDQMTGDEADLGFENMPANFEQYLQNLPRELNPPIHPTEGTWKYWATVEQGQVILFW